MSLTQPMPRPETWAEFEAIKSRMIDTHGKPLVSEWCARCRGQHFTVEPHLDEAPCPQCGSGRRRCMRPSGHEAASWHQERRELFARICDQRQAEGLPVVALWP